MRTTQLAGILALAVCAALGTIIGGLQVAAAQSGNAVIRVTAPATPIKKGDERVPFEVTVENVKNLAAFSFDLTYDAGIFQIVDAQRDAEKGDFLGSSGRPVVCNPPITDSGAGVARFTCVTLGPTPLGADGSGKIATMYLKASGSGSTDIALKNVKAYGVGDQTVPPTDPRQAPEIPLNVENTSASVAGSGGGISWIIWAALGVVAIVVVGAGGFAVMRMRTSSKTATAV